jgi:hypothetical protein
MKKMRKDLITDFNWAQCSFCRNIYPVEKGLPNRKHRPRINKSTGLCTNCEKIKGKL